MCQGYPCGVLTFCSIRMVQLYCFVFKLREYHKITQIQNGRHFKIVCSQKFIRSLADIAVHVCQIKKICWKLFSETLVALVIKGLIIWESTIPRWYVMAM